MKYDTPKGINGLNPSTLTIYPNPSTDKITIETSASLTLSKLSILNLYGEELIIGQITESKTQIDINTLPCGIYFVRLSNENIIEVGKIIKN
jgi:hypothetical protein